MRRSPADLLCWNLLPEKPSHAGQTTVTITNSHAKASAIQAAMRELTVFFKELACTAEQLGTQDKVKLIAKRAYRKILPIFQPLAGQKLLPVAG